MRQSPDQLTAVVFQPFAVHPIIGADPFHLCPKSGRVVHFDSVAQLVYHHIIPHLLGAQHQQAVEVQIALGGAGAPSAALIADGDSAVGHTNERGEILHPPGQVLFCGLGQLSDFLMGEGFRLRALFCFVQMLFNPSRLFCQKRFDVLQRHFQRCADDDAAVGMDLEGKGLSLGADDLVLAFRTIQPPLEAGA